MYWPRLASNTNMPAMTLPGLEVDIVMVVAATANEAPADTVAMLSVGRTAAVVGNILTGIGLTSSVSIPDATVGLPHLRADVLMLGCNGPDRGLHEPSGARLSPIVLRLLEVTARRLEGCPQAWLDVFERDGHVSDVNDIGILVVDDERAMRHTIMMTGVDRYFADDDSLTRMPRRILGVAEQAALRNAIAAFGVMRHIARPHRAARYGFGRELF
jgi:hypothetical protein